MCEPTTLMLGLSVASAVSGYFGQRQSAKAQQAAYMNSMNAQLGDLDAQSQEIEGTAAGEKSDLAIEALRKIGAARVASGENLGMGNTVSALIQDQYAQYGRNVTGIEVNRQRAQKQNVREREGVRTSTAGKIAGIEKPSLISTGLQVASAGAEYYAGQPTTLKNAPSPGRVASKRSS